MPRSSRNSNPKYASAAGFSALSAAIAVFSCFNTMESHARTAPGASPEPANVTPMAFTPCSVSCTPTLGCCCPLCALQQVLQAVSHLTTDCTNTHNNDVVALSLRPSSPIAALVTTGRAVYSVLYEPVFRCCASSALPLVEHTLTHLSD